jgi:SNF2 family DNA or RNA helicase
MVEDDDEVEDLDNSGLPDDEEEIISKKNPVFSPEFESSKMRQLYEDIDKLKVLAAERDENMDKVVVVSQWTSLLDIVERHLTQKGYSTCTISG